jgi:hypothetical protein
VSGSKKCNIVFVGLPVEEYSSYGSCRSYLVIILTLFCRTTLWRPGINGNVKAPSSGLNQVFSPRGLSLILGFSNAFTVAAQFLVREAGRLAQLEEHLSQVQEIEGRTILSQDKTSQLSTPSFKNFLPLPSAPASQAHSPDPNVNSGGGPTHHPPGPSFLPAGAKKCGPDVFGSPTFLWDDHPLYELYDPNPFTPPAGLFIPPSRVPYHHQSHSASDWPVKKAQKQKYHGEMAQKRDIIGFEENVKNPDATLWLLLVFFSL